MSATFDALVEKLDRSLLALSGGEFGLPERRWWAEELAEQISEEFSFVSLEKAESSRLVITEEER